MTPLPNLLAALCASAWIAGSCVAQTEDTPLATAQTSSVSAELPRSAIPDPVLHRANWMEQHEALKTLASKGNIDVLFLGDSLTKGWGSGGRDVWAARFAPMRAANFGISGDWTQNLLWRIQNGELENIRPKAVVLMIGTNNLLDKNCPPEEIAQAITVITREIHRLLPDTHILLLGILPKKELANNAVRQRIKDTNAIISRLHDGKHITYLDFGDKLLLPNGNISKDVMAADFCHLTAKGYEIYAAAIEPILASILAKP